MQKSSDRSFNRAARLVYYTPMLIHWLSRFNARSLSLCPKNVDLYMYFTFHVQNTAIDSKAKVRTALHTAHCVRESSFQFIYAFRIFTYVPAIIAGKSAFSDGIHKS